MKKLVLALLGLALLIPLAACESQAKTANDNLTKACDNFECARRIVGINGITDKVLFEVTGFCSYETGGDTIQAICKDPDGTVTRTTLGKADNVTFVVTQLSGQHVDLFHHRVIFAPERVIPNFDLSTSSNP